jgi:MYXO-CTERM domain-containing protein
MPRSPYALVLVPCALVLAPPAAAAEPESSTLFGQPVNQPRELSDEEIAARRAEFEHALQERDLIEAPGLVVPRSQIETDFAMRPQGQRAHDEVPHRQTIFLNFFGGKMRGGNIASEMESPCIMGGEIDYPGYVGNEQNALAIIQVFKDAMEPYGIRIAYDRVPPKHLPYSMVMMGGRPGVIGLPNGVLGVSCNLDCGEQWWRDTTFAFTEQAGDIQVLGTTALQEAAHSWGLDHIDGEQNIMYPFATLGKKVWADGCTKYNPATGAIGCEYVHDEFCGADGGAQDDVAELLAYFGPNSADTVPPEVKMISPENGAQLKPGEELTIEVEVSDNFEGYGWTLQVPELKQELPAYYGEKKWTFPVPTGEFTIRVEAIDHDRNIGFAEAKIYVGVEPPTESPTTGETPTTSDTAGESGSATAGETGSATAGETDDSATAGVDTGDDKGCNCATSPVSKDMATWSLALLALGIARRRRR